MELEHYPSSVNRHMGLFSLPSPPISVENSVKFKSFSSFSPLFAGFPQNIVQLFGPVKEFWVHPSCWTQNSTFPTTAISLSQSWPSSGSRCVGTSAVSTAWLGMICPCSVIFTSTLNTEHHVGTNQRDEIAHPMEFCPWSFTSSFLLSLPSFHFLSTRNCF